MAGGGRRKLGHATPRELFPSTSHANMETSQEVTPSPEPGVGGSGTSTQVPETQDGNSPMGEKQYLWNVDLDALVKKEYEKKAHKSLKEITYNVSVRNKSVRRWMGESMFERIMAKRKDPKAGGVLPTALEVFLKTHFKEVPGKGKVGVTRGHNKSR
uniref:Uncharacterized protein n=1 Tax=Chenopodium quinoa TaxID=63459 RepID=A0A803MDS3_CHEQI